MATDPEENRDPFLDHLRHRIEGADLMPSPQVWASLSNQLPAPNPWLTRYVGTGLGLGIIVGLLLGWLGGSGAKTAAPARPVVVATRVAHPALTTRYQQNTSAGAPTAAPALGITNKVRPTAVAPLPARIITRIVTRTNVLRESSTVPAAPLPPVVAAGGVATPGMSAATLPVAIRTLPALWHSAVVLDSAISQAGTPVLGETAVAATRRHEHLLALAADQQPVLLALHDEIRQWELHTRKALQEVPPTLATDSLPSSPVAGPLVAADSVPRPVLAPLHRWSALVLTENTTAWGTLPGYNPATTRERLLGATTNSVAIEYRTPGRWRIRAGFGETRLRDQFRFIHDSLHHTVRHDTTWANSFTVNTTREATYTTRLDSIGRPEPIINAQGQVIGYTTVYTHYHDTTHTITTRHDTLRRMEEHVHIREEFRNERRQQELRPDYKFWTVPVALQFDVIRRPRWSAGLNVGGQFLFFRGGYRPVHDVATGTYALRRIGATEGPFRPVSLTLNTGLDVRYRLSDRLSLLAGGGVRGWAVGPLRSAPLPRWTWGAQWGISWELGR